MTPVLVKHIMTSPVVTFFAEQTLPLAEDVMRFKHLRHLPVIDDGGVLVGLVTHRELVAARLAAGAGADLRVHEIMNRDVWTVTAKTLASVAGATLHDHRYGCLPVVDLTRTLVGIVTERDFLRFAVRTLRMNDPEEFVRATTSATRARAA
jgi:CBS domain-containing membrane protein